MRTMLLCLCFVAASYASAPADDTTGMVEGRLVDAAGHAATGVELQLNGASGVVWTRSDRSGHFVFFSVPPGRYDLWAAEGAIGGGVLTARPCEISPLLEVDAGLTWHLGALWYASWPSNDTCVISYGRVLTQLTSAGTTADVYVIPGP
jgi:hypothetical protein